MNAPLASRLTQRPNIVTTTDRSRMGSVRGVRNTRWAGAVARSTPPVQAGSSIMPGTVSPVLAEAAHQAAFGDRHAVTTTMTAEDGQHHLNAFEPQGFRVVHRGSYLTVFHRGRPPGAGRP